MYSLPELLKISHNGVTQQGHHMTREEALERYAELEKRRQALVDQLTEADTQSASLSAGGGSKSYTNRSVADLRAKIKFIEAEMARLAFALGRGPDPSLPKRIAPRYC